MELILPKSAIEVVKGIDGKHQQLHATSALPEKDLSAG